MAKFETFVGVMLGLTLLFYVTGLLENTPNSTLFDLLLDPGSIQTSSLFAKVLAIFSAVSIAGIAVGFFTSTNPKVIAVSTFVIFFASLMWDFIAVVNKVYSVHPGFAILIFSPLLVVYILALISWWGYISQ